jgi:RNA polymerase sigma-70 factor, ECF subfamily
MVKGRTREGASDHELLATYRRDPESEEGRNAISELFGRYRMAIYRWCIRYTKEHESALDIAQESMMEAFRALGNFEGRAQFSSWLFAIARYRCISAVRQKGNRIDPDVDLDGLASDGPDIEMEIIGRMEEERALKLLNDTLDPVERQAVWLRCYEEMPVPEITRLLGITDRSGARGLLQRARRKLRSALTSAPADTIEGER